MPGNDAQRASGINSPRRHGYGAGQCAL